MNSQSAEEQLARLIEGVKREAYTRGFEDAKRLFREMVDSTETPDLADVVQTVQVRSIERKPAGHNKAVVVQILSCVGAKGLGQSAIISEAQKIGETMAQSSVRHALKQLESDGRVRHRKHRWSLVPEGKETAEIASEADSAVSRISYQGGSNGAALASSG